MGINSTEVSYGFGQLGSAFIDSGSDFFPPTGRKIIAITFLADTKLTTLQADESGIDDPDAEGNVGYFGTGTTPSLVLAHGNNSTVVDVEQVFPAGLTIYGRWTKVKLNNPGDSDGGVICYFGK